MDPENAPPPRYRDLPPAAAIDENASNEMVIDWLLRQQSAAATAHPSAGIADEDSLNSSSSDNSTRPSSNLTVVRIDNRNQRRLSMATSAPASSLLRRSSSSPRCFVCHEKISDVFNDSTASNNNITNNNQLDESIYICDGCYESWYSAPVGLLPPTTNSTNIHKVTRRLRGEDSVETDSSSKSSTVYSLTKDNKLNFASSSPRKRSSIANNNNNF